MSGTVTVRGVGNVVCVGDGNRLAVGGLRRNVVAAGDGLAWMPVRIPRALRRRVGRWAIEHHVEFADALARLAEAALDAEA